MIILTESYMVMNELSEDLIRRAKHKNFKNLQHVLNSNGLDDNYRFEIWQHSLELFSRNPLTIILGSGITSNFGYTLTAIGYQHTIVVSHSTIFQTMVMGGLLGVTCLGIHLYEKYNL